MSTHDPSIVAADPALSAWVAANAGSGKTYTLANRVTRLLLADARPERILCLTYTKAAAAEMQGRLFDQLGLWAMLPDAELRKNIESIGASAKTAEDLRKARRLFAQALETPGGLKIQTIHAFCQTLLSRFPLEAGVPPGFRVLDDQTARELMEEARTRVLAGSGAGDAQRFAAIVRLATETSEMRMRQILDAALGTDRRKLERFFMTLDGSDDALGRALRKTHELAEGETAELIATAFGATAVRSKQQLRDIAQWLAGGGKMDKERSEKLARALAAPTEREIFAGLRAALLTADGARPARLVTKSLAEARTDLHAALDAFVAKLLETDERHRIARACELCQAALTIADAVRTEYARAKRLRSALDYDDLIVKTLELLNRKSAAAWVLYKLDGGLDHVLVDEAQDTSPEQWDIVRKLTEEFFAGEGARDGKLTRTIFAVGDEKQSIFSFQGANPKLFEENRTHFMQHAQAAERAFVSEPLVTSRRSAPEVLGFVDRVFAADSARTGLTSSGAPIEHQAFRATARGRVEFWPALKPSDAPEPDPWRPVDTVSEASPISRLAVQIADQIGEWIAHRVRLPDHPHPIKPGDIMILLPRREPFGSEIIRKLKERRIPVAGADRIKLTEQIAVMDLVALGRFVLLPSDDLNLAALLRSPLCGLGEEELFSLCHERRTTVWDELQRRRDELASFSTVHEFLADMRARADFSPPYEFYAHALTAHGMRKRLLARLGAEANDVIDEFLSLSFAYESASPPSLEGFLHWIERGGAEIKRDMERGRNEVRVMTVHGAKGLEADIVILPDTTSLPDPPSLKGHLLYTDDGVMYPLAEAAAPEIVKRVKRAAHAETLSEHRRLFYVALTRARDRLYICGFENKRGVREGSWYRLAENAAAALGVEVLRGSETVRVFGEPGEQYGLAVESERAPAEIPSWAAKPPPPAPPTPRLIRPSDATDAIEPAPLSPLEPGNAKRFRRGTLVHTLLSHLPDIAPEARREMALRYLRVRDVDDDQARSLTDETLAVVNDPAFAPAFAPGSRAEAAITAELPEIAPGARINGRLDRLAVSADEVLIVDFKTNRPPPETEAEVGELYLSQMALYRAAAAKIFPGRRIGCALVWTEGPRLMRLSGSLLDAQIARIRRRLDPQG
jgi:ATP-dependent helicase/nuclease subunit A